MTPTATPLALDLARSAPCLLWWLLTELLAVRFGVLVFVAVHSGSRKTSIMRLPVNWLAHPINWALVLVVLLTV